MSLARLAPGLAALGASTRAGLGADLRAGLASAAVGLPASLAFAQLMDLPPATALQASILPTVAYALFGCSRRLVVAADTATCVLIAGSLSAMGLVEPELRAAYAAVLALLAGVFCLGAGWLRLGAVADFLAWPILVGFLNGVAIDLAIAQLPRMLGLPSDAAEAPARLLALARNLPLLHPATALAAFGTLALLLGLRRAAPRLPAALIACAAAGLASWLLDLAGLGVATLGAIPDALPGLALPDVTLAGLMQHRDELLENAAGIALISFASFMVPVRAFAARRGESTDADREVVALGIAHLVAGLAQGFAVSGSTTRTASAEAAGAEGPAAALFAAALLALAMAALGGPLGLLPHAAMAALLVQASLSLLDLRAIGTLWRLDRTEAALAIVATLGVLLVGPLTAVLLSVGLAVARFIRLTARPVAEELGRLSGTPGFHSRRVHPAAHTEPGMIFFRFNAPIVFFNAAAFQRAALAAADAAEPGLEWFVLDLFPITQVDVTGLETLRVVNERLAACGVRLVGAGRRTELQQWLALSESALDRANVLLFPTMNAARHAFRAARKAKAEAASAPAGGGRG